MQEFLTITALIFFNLLCSFGLIILVYVFLLLRKLNQSIEEVKFSIQNRINTVDEAINNFGWMTTVVPFIIDLLPIPKKRKGGFFGRK